MHAPRIILVLTFFVIAIAVAAQTDIRFVPAAGRYGGPVEVLLEGEDAGVIHFTTDGSLPTERSPQYGGELLFLSRSTVLRAVVLRDGEVAGRLGATYLIDEPPSGLLTVSVGIDPWRLFNRRYGWFVEGPDPEEPNWETHREHATHIDILEGDGSVVHSGTMGFRMFGGASRAHPQKSFSLSGRASYGNKRVDHPLFGPDGENDFRFLVLRNGGSDWGRSFIRDALMTGLLRDPSWTLDVPDARPAQVYINGKYWGIYHLREKINPRFLEDHHSGVHKDSLSLLEHQNSVKHGRGTEYEALRSLIRESDPADPAVYARITRLMDVDNYQQLQIAQTYFDNQDAGGNIRYWRPHSADGRFRWILYDVDQGFGLHRSEGWTHNTLEQFTAADGPVWPNPPWSTLFQRKLLANYDYRRNFVNRSLDYLHTDFSAESVLEQIDQAVATLQPEMPRQLVRWGLRPELWERQIDQLRRFGLYRPSYLREHYRSYFSGGPDRFVRLSASLGGYIVLNGNMQVGTDGLEGSYFANYPIGLQAVAEPGYRFIGWEGLSTSSDSLILDLGDDREYTIAAQFEAVRHAAAESIVINEISPKNAGSDDWLEIYNRSDQAVDMTGWYLVDDSGERFVLPRTVLPALGFLIVCRDEERFAKSYPHVRDHVGNLPFGLDKQADRIGLYAADGAYVNAITYDLDAGTDSTFIYALALPGLDNTRHRNWVRESGPGTPGSANPDHLQSAIMTRQRFWVRIGVGLALLLVVGVIRSYRGGE